MMLRKMGCECGVSGRIEGENLNLSLGFLDWTEWYGR